MDDTNELLSTSRFGRDRVPDKKPKNSDYHEWKDAYLNHLINMYTIVNGNQKINIKKFNFFCKLVYSTSSIHISPYL